MLLQQRLQAPWPLAQASSSALAAPASLASQQKKQIMPCPLPARILASPGCQSQPSSQPSSQQQLRQPRTTPPPAADLRWGTLDAQAGGQAQKPARHAARQVPSRAWPRAGGAHEAAQPLAWQDASPGLSCLHQQALPRRRRLRPLVSATTQMLAAGQLACWGR